MRPITRTLFTALLGLAVSFPLLSSTSSAAIAQPVALTEPPACSDVLLIGARGSGQAPSTGMGAQVTSFSMRLEQQLAAGGRSLEQRPLNGTEYAAKGVGWLAVDAVTPRNPFFGGIAHGVSSTLTALKAAATRCPRQRIVLAGYSQGAMVMHRTLLQLAATGNTDILRRIDGAVLIADGDRRRYTKTRLIGSPVSGAGGIGIRSMMRGAQRDITGAMAHRTWTVCTRYDVVCNYTSSRVAIGTSIHTGATYRDSPAIRKAASGVAAEVRATPSPINASLAVPVSIGEPIEHSLAADVTTGYELTWRAGGPLPQGLTMSPLGVVTGTASAQFPATTPVEVRSSILGVGSGWVPATVTWTYATPPPPQTPVLTSLHATAVAQENPRGVKFTIDYTVEGDSLLASEEDYRARSGTGVALPASYGRAICKDPGSGAITSVLSGFFPLVSDLVNTSGSARTYRVVADSPTQNPAYGDCTWEELDLLSHNATEQRFLTTAALVEGGFNPHFSITVP